MFSRLRNDYLIMIFYMTLHMDNIYCQYYCLLFVNVTATSTNFFIIKSTRCTNFTNLFWHETLHVLDSSSAHHQEFIHCTLSNGICHAGL